MAGRRRHEGRPGDELLRARRDQEFGGAPAPVTALFTGDEEIGSPFSRPVIEQHARAARGLFNSEPGRARGAAVTGRKGGVFMRFEITGKAAHSGANFEQGISAINELAQRPSRCMR